MSFVAVKVMKGEQALLGIARMSFSAAENVKSDSWLSFLLRIGRCVVQIMGFKCVNLRGFNGFLQ